MTEQPQKITLLEWATAQFKKVPHVNTLRKWAHDGNIEPKPEKVGREYLVLPTARYVAKDRPQ